MDPKLNFIKSQVLLMVKKVIHLVFEVFTAVACHLLTCWFLLKFSSTLKMEAICSSETSVAFQQTTRHHIPEDDTLQSHT
jgi:hypothetical protein